MNETIEKYIDILKKQGVKVNAPNFNLLLWKAETNNFLQRIFGQNTAKITQISNIIYQSTVADSGYVYSDNLDECKEQAKALIKSYIAELQTFGLPNNDKTTNKIATQTDDSPTSSSPQSIDIQIILDIVQYELTGRQYKDIQEIVNNNAAQKDKIVQLADKLKTFSADVSANILASIFTQIGDF